MCSILLYMTGHSKEIRYEGMKKKFEADQMEILESNRGCDVIPLRWKGQKET